MHESRSHPCRLSVAEAIEIQKSMARRVIRESQFSPPKFIAGVDISAKRYSSKARAAVVVVSFPGLEPVETQTFEGELTFPYVPGLLTFREAPLSAAACNKLSVKPDVFLVDGQGFAHPRRCGFACHLGLLLDKPTIGCAKSLLTGSFEEPGEKAGSCSDIKDKEDIIGAAVRTKDRTKPVYVSVGHRVNLQDAINLVLRCCRAYRIPEPLRLAHAEAGRTTES